MESRKSNFFISYLEKNKIKLSSDFKSDQTRRSPKEMLYLFHSIEISDLPFDPESQAFKEIQRIYHSPDTLLSKEDAKKLFDLITEEGFFELFNLDDATTIKEDITLFLRKNFGNYMEINNEIFLLRAYTYAIWFTIQKHAISQGFPLRILYGEDNETFFYSKSISYFQERFEQFKKRKSAKSLDGNEEILAKPSASTDAAAIICSTLLIAFCAAEAPIVLLLLILLIGPRFYSRYNNGYYFFQPNSPPSHQLLTPTPHLSPSFAAPS